MSSQAAPPDPQTDTASQYANTWAGGDDPDHMPLPKTLAVQYHQPAEIGRGGTPNYLYQCTLACTVVNSLTFKMWKFTQWQAPKVPGKPIKIFSCSTADSRVVAPTLSIDKSLDGPANTDVLKSGCFGPYIESIVVEMWFDYPHALLETFAPATDEQRGEQSDSVSYSFDAGFFGGDATASMSATYTSSHSIELTDFELSSMSDASTNKTHQMFALSMQGNGAPYDSNQVRNFGYPQSPSFMTLPVRAESDFPFSVEGLWELPGSADDTVDFHIRVTVVCPLLIKFMNFVASWQETIGVQQANGGYSADTKLFQSFVWEHVEKVDLSLADELAQT